MTKSGKLLQTDFVFMMGMLHSETVEGAKWQFLHTVALIWKIADVPLPNTV